MMEAISIVAAAVVGGLFRRMLGGWLALPRARVVIPVGVFALSVALYPIAGYTAFPAAALFALQFAAFGGDFSKNEDVFFYHLFAGCIVGVSLCALTQTLLPLMYAASCAVIAGAYWACKTYKEQVERISGIGWSEAAEVISGGGAALILAIVLL